MKSPHLVRGFSILPRLMTAPGIQIRSQQLHRWIHREELWPCHGQKMDDIIYPCNAICISFKKTHNCCLYWVTFFLSWVFRSLKFGATVPYCTLFGADIPLGLVDGIGIPPIPKAWVDHTRYGNPCNSTALPWLCKREYHGEI